MDEQKFRYSASDGRGHVWIVGMLMHMAGNISISCVLFLYYMFFLNQIRANNTFIPVYFTVLLYANIDYTRIQRGQMTGGQLLLGFATRWQGSR